MSAVTTQLIICVWGGSEATFVKLVLPFHHVHSRNQTHIIKLCGEGLNPLSHLTSP